ncbi:hypothetical protein UC34_17585 [Pandoraea vervacti]|uniref:Uncharacterized protein n=1 Tax=Pandoraea vervacti TaxID=656178 RepID=A0ABM5T0K0_9BURK|nr:hypothetical protein [Pandoraea vervacti]AJP58287.1 hypothetical protein UC34_17585 [Pandoraea vervacti]
MNTRDKFSRREASGANESRQLQAPVVPLAEANGGIRRKDVYTNLDESIAVNVPWNELMLPGDTLELYWGDKELAVDVIIIEFHTDPNWQMHVPVTDVIRVEDGLIDVWYHRISSFGDPVPQPSPVIQVLVKTTVPGGNDPDPSTFPLNENLPKVILPDGPIEAPIPDEGIPVTIPVWDNMTAGDRVKLFWASEGTQFDPIDETQVDQPLTLLVPKAVIEKVGDGTNVAVTYEILDVVSNWSGRAAPSFIEVDVGGTLYIAPLLPDLNNGVLDYDALNGEDVQTIVTQNGDMAEGDDVTIIFEGRSFDGWEVSHSETKTLGGDGMVSFDIPNVKVGEAVPGDGSVFYRVEVGGVDKGRSRRRAFTIEGTAQALPAPDVREASDSTLDPAAVLAGANVDVAPWVGMAIGDLLTLRWEGTTAGGDPLLHTEPKRLEPQHIGNTVSFNVPYSKIAPIAGGSVDVLYTVESGVSTRTSDHLALTVLALQALPQPIVEGERGGELDPADVPNGPQLTLPEWPRMAVGDEVRWFWLGTSPGGQQSDLEDVTAVGDVTVRVDRNVLEINANGGDTVNVLYEVTYAGGGRSASLTKQVRILPLSDALLPPPVVEEAVGDSLNPDDIDEFATVRVDPYPGMASGQTVWVYFGEGTGGGEKIESFLVSDQNLNQPIHMYVPKAKVEYFDTSTVTVYYRVVKAPGVEERSEDLVLNVSRPVRWGAPSVPQSIDGNLPEGAYERGVQTIVHQHPDMQANDVIDLYWEGAGKPTYPDRVVVGVPMDFPFRVEKAIVDRWKGETVTIRYTVTRASGIIHSDHLTLNVGFVPTDLADPEMDQVIDDKLNLSDLTYGADVRALAYDGMRIGDYVHFDWAGGEENDGVTVKVQITQNMVGQPVEDYFRLVDIEPYIDQTVDVSYRVLRQNVPVGQSNPITFGVVRDAATFDPPRIPAVVNGELDLRQVTGGVEVIVDVNEAMARGDDVVLTWDCSNDAGDYSNTVPVGGGATVEFTVPFEYLEAGIDGTVNVSYEVRRGGGLRHPHDRVACGGDDASERRQSGPGRRAAARCDGIDRCVGQVRSGRRCHAQLAGRSAVSGTAYDSTDRYWQRPAADGAEEQRREQRRLRRQGLLHDPAQDWGRDGNVT